MTDFPNHSNQIHVQRNIVQHDLQEHTEGANFGEDETVEIFAAPDNEAEQTYRACPPPLAQLQTADVAAGTASSSRETARC